MSDRFKVAIVGSGPSGFFAADSLLNAELQVHVDLFERLPAPFGLVRYGVAPDHPKLKSTIKVFERIAKKENFEFCGNLDIGKDLPFEQLQTHYDAVILAHGSRNGRTLGIPGETLPGCHTATEFVGWYNGHPDFADRTFNLNCQSAVVIGNGNVAIDIARILTLSIDELKKTDIAAHALDALSTSRIEVVHIVGRRGPVQASFTNQELRELGEMKDVEVVVSNHDLGVNSASQTELDDKKNFPRVKNLELLQAFADGQRGLAPKQIRFHFCQSPVRAIGGEKLESLELDINRLEGNAFQQTACPSGERVRLDCGLLFSSIGYHGEPVASLPFDVRRGTYLNQNGIVTDTPGVFVAGWIKRGPSGIIGTNKACSNETVGHVLDFLESECQAGRKAGFAGLSLSQDKQVVDYSTWERLDRLELEAGSHSGKPREKIIDFAKALANF